MSEQALNKEGRAKVQTRDHLPSRFYCNKGVRQKGNVFTLFKYLSKDFEMMEKRPKSIRTRAGNKC